MQLSSDRGGDRHHLDAAPVKYCHDEERLSLCTVTDTVHLDAAPVYNHYHTGGRRDGAREDGDRILSRLVWAFLADSTHQQGRVGRPAVPPAPPRHRETEPRRTVWSSHARGVTPGTRGFEFVLVPATNKCVESRPCICRLRDGGRDAGLQNVDAVTALLRALKINKRVVLSLRDFNTARVSILCGWNWLALASCPSARWLCCVLSESNV